MAGDEYKYLAVCPAVDLSKLIQQIFIKHVGKVLS